MLPLLSMRSASGRWRVKEFDQRGRRLYLVLERQAAKPSCVVTMGRIMADLEQVAALLGDEFDQLEDDRSALEIPMTTASRPQ